MPKQENKHTYLKPVVINEDDIQKAGYGGREFPEITKNNSEEE